MRVDVDFGLTPSGAEPRNVYVYYCGVFWLRAQVTQVPTVAEGGVGRDRTATATTGDETAARWARRAAPRELQRLQLC